MPAAGTPDRPPASSRIDEHQEQTDRPTDHQEHQKEQTTMIDCYPPLPPFAARRPDETAQDYGLRAFAYVTRYDHGITVPADALELAAHVYPIVISAPGLEQPTIDRLATVNQAIHATIRRRQTIAAQDAADQAQTIAAAAAAGAGRDKPTLGPGAPLTPPPTPNPPPTTYATPAPRQAPPPAAWPQPTAPPIGITRPQPAATLTRQDFGF